MNELTSDTARVGTTKRRLARRNGCLGLGLGLCRLEDSVELGREHNVALDLHKVRVSKPQRSKESFQMNLSLTLSWPDMKAWERMHSVSVNDFVAEMRDGTHLLPVNLAVCEVLESLVLEGDGD